MKRILLFALVGTMFIACKEKNEPYDFNKFLPVYLNGVENPKYKSSTRQYSLDYIVRDSSVLLSTSLGVRGFAPEQRDTINKRLLMWSTDIITASGTILYEFIGQTDIHLIIHNGEKFNELGQCISWDTCGYIPQSIIDSAREQIEALYAQERYDEIYDLFHTAFTFYTCTGAEYKSIMANGGN